MMRPEKMYSCVSCLAIDLLHALDSGSDESDGSEEPIPHSASNHDFLPLTTLGTMATRVVKDDFFGVFVGHGGIEATGFLTHRLHPIFIGLLARWKVRN